MKRALILIFIISLTAACGPQPEPQPVIDPISGPDQNAQQQASWSAQTLTDARSAQQFTIDNLQPVFVAPFATWCEACTQQLTQLDASEYEYVALATDNEDISSVREYAAQHSLSGKFSVPKQSFVDLLVAEFGPGVQNLRQAPTILVCGSESYALEPGVMNAQTLQERAERLC